MKDHKPLDVVIIGGSYAGLAAGMALGRALKNVLIIDDGKPCNRQTPHSHNFLTGAFERAAPKDRFQRRLNRFPGGALRAGTL